MGKADGAHWSVWAGRSGEKNWLSANIYRAGRKMPGEMVRMKGIQSQTQKSPTSLSGQRRAGENYSHASRTCSSLLIYNSHSQTDEAPHRASLPFLDQRPREGTHPKQEVCFRLNLRSLLVQFEGRSPELFLQHPIPDSAKLDKYLDPRKLEMIGN